ncbi:MAG: hypothetical protein SVX43_15040 [Cyanobacteriota bacterium]|nr:hypothetical protein [Cyanobacteriota bacterium]
MGNTTWVGGLLSQRSVSYAEGIGEGLEEVAVSLRWMGWERDRCSFQHLAQSLFLDSPASHTEGINQ